MKDFFNKKINLILTIILIALIIYNLFNKPLIEGITRKYSLKTMPGINNLNNVPCSQRITLPAPGSKETTANNVLTAVTASAAGVNCLGVNSNNTTHMIGKIKEKQNNLNNRVNNEVND